MLGRSRQNDVKTCWIASWTAVSLHFNTFSCSSVFHRPPSIRLWYLAEKINEMVIINKNLLRRLGSYLEHLWRLLLAIGGNLRIASVKRTASSSDCPISPRRYCTHRVTRFGSGCSKSTIICVPCKLVQQMLKQLFASVMWKPDFFKADQVGVIWPLPTRVMWFIWHRRYLDREDEPQRSS